jgi:peroxiredoxin
MGLEQQLEEFKEQFLRTAPAGRTALYEAKIEELRTDFALESVAGMGTQAPEFRLPDVKGDLVSLTNLLRDGPVVVTFYRGGWRPCCNIQLRAALRSTNKALPGINGDEGWELPVPATCVIARDGRIALAYIEVDYRKRREPGALLDILRSLQPS